MSKTYPFLIALSTLFLINSTALSQSVPELMYYKFDQQGLAQTNLASAPVGTNPTVVLGLSLTSNGQFGTALEGNGGSSDMNGVDNGWATNLGANPWTISMWVSNLPATVTTSHYFFGDAGAALRCFTGGVAGNNNIMLRGNTMTDVSLSSVGSAPVVIHFVHEVAPANVIKVYIDGILVNTVSQSGPLNITGSGFKIGGYSTVSSLPMGCLMDEFRMYNRALSTTEVANTWNIPLGATPMAAAFVDISAFSVGEDIRLSWEVSAESDVERYIVERSSDGRVFYGVGAVAAGIGTERYEFIDNGARRTSANPSLFYRILTREMNGATTFSKVVTVKESGYKPGIAVYPNPFSEELAISISSDEEGTAAISIVDMEGRVVDRQEWPLHKGANWLKQERISKLAKGAYQLNVRFNANVFSEMIVKK